MIALSIILFCYRPQTKLREGYVFTCVCDFVHRGVVSQHALQGSRPKPREEVEGSGGCLQAHTRRGVSLHALRQTLLADGYCCGRYASYWNTYLLLISYYWHNITKQLICLTYIMKFTPNHEIDNPNLRCTLYRSGTVNSNTVNSKFHLNRSFFEIFARFLSFHV